MSDLADLIETANEIYLINPSRNVRSAYIQIDDLCELTMKSYLQIAVSGWSPNKSNNQFKNFWDITREIRAQHPSNPVIDELMSRIEERRKNRNHFFHDQNQSGLTVHNDHCLRAFCDLYELMDNLFPGAMAQNATPTLRAQVAAIKVLKDCERDAAKKQTYNQLMSNWSNGEGGPRLHAKGEVRVQFPNLAYDYCVIHYYASQFYDALLSAGLIKP